MTLLRDIKYRELNTGSEIEFAKEMLPKPPPKLIVFEVRGPATNLEFYYADVLNQ